MRLIEKLVPALLLLLLPLSAHAAESPLPEALAAPGERAVLTVHADGQQIYECKAGSDGKQVWTLREPAATLITDGKIAGRHFAGPTWQLNDGSAVVGKMQASVPGKTAADVSWLKLEVVSHRGNGLLADVDTVQRINTIGGAMAGSCDRPTATRAMPYTADYIFLRKD
ncbi:DUF3455 domain-containing protein [Bradyrhizobium sp. ARR65]|uniref:DUF3455 domain-containing protein n=1 Tax=Bradyrhizobium sp. ARR65 TaxID=1040989 RepID=UPI0004662CC0|nr:DUF3455 domain-containing protein [Bradyrhizobium sp. ARR65]